jgi:hypothetical protein
MIDDNPHADALPPGPSWRDWGLLAVNLGFVGMGLFILPGKFDVGIVTIAFFGFCALVPITTILRKQRNRRLRPVRAAVIGGMPIRPSRLRTAALAGGMLALGSTLIVFGVGYPLPFRIVAWLIAGAGTFLAFGMSLGKYPVGHLMFTPQGITIGLRRYATTVSWDDMLAWDAAEFNDNPVLRIWLRPGATLVVNPPAWTARAESALASNHAWLGAPIAIMTSTYALDLPLLIKAIERYVREPASRGELDSSRLLPSDSGARSVE